MSEGLTYLYSSRILRTRSSTNSIASAMRTCSHCSRLNRLCAREELNLHALIGHWHLKPARLPFRHSRVASHRCSPMRLPRLGRLAPPAVGWAAFSGRSWTPLLLVGVKNRPLSDYGGPGWAPPTLWTSVQPSDPQPSDPQPPAFQPSPVHTSAGGRPSGGLSGGMERNCRWCSL